ncbi:hypothetical protein Y032_0009g554 [Ancylostoma ceylanicum]|uniref:GIY-YIG domain-containing protein n=1 Tax=Ancylostoma ceylanicum TaxID=53326 RepID=A0A016VK80_9BILA|nr:hypothetical protein Y032_0009g554 [Ancylostoma ceylanicum]
MISGAIYLISCKECGAKYIEETGRPLCIRIKEHLDGKNKQRSSTALGGHRLRHHDGVDFDVEITILAREIQTPARKALEAFLIRAKNPEMNRKEECLSITQELNSYLRQLFRCQLGTFLPKRQPRQHRRPPSPTLAAAVAGDGDAGCYNPRGV